jgi:hypothetical protein
MALVKTCPTCGFANVPTSPFCLKCRISLVAVAPSEHVEKPTEQCDPQSCDTGESVCPDCKAENEPGAERCVYCDCALTFAVGGPAPCHVELAWPWGKDQLTKPLRIGREPPCPESLIKAINAHGYDNISRSHAELVPDSVTGGVSLIDLGSSNGTFVDGVRISPNTPIVLKSGAVVRFAANLSVTVVITRS